MSSGAVFFYRKEGSLTWKRRHFVLDGEKLVYYNAAEDIPQEPAGWILVPSCTLENIPDVDKLCMFSIQCPYTGQTYFLATEDKEQRQEWFENVSRLASSTSSLLPSSLQPTRRRSSLESKRPPSRSVSPRPAPTNLTPTPDDKGAHNKQQPQQQHQQQHQHQQAQEQQSQVRDSAEKEKEKPKERSSVLDVSRTSTLTYNPHRLTRPSLLSSDAESHNYRGLLNLGAVLLVATNFRLVVENLLKYGLLIQLPSNFGMSTYHNWPCLSSTLALPIFVLIAYGIQRLSYKGASDWLVNLLSGINLIAATVIPVYVIVATHANPGPAAFLLVLAVIISMKLLSYAHVYDDLREDKRLKDAQLKLNHMSDQVQTGEKDHDEKKNAIPLSLRHLFYFVAAPTLCFQLQYPRTTRIRKRWLLKRVAEMLIAIAFMILLIEQYVVPTVRNSMSSLVEMNLARLSERVLKLAVPFLYIWLAMFFSLFHCWLNIAAELLRFGDRCFYKDWWNALTLEEYWRTWNLPVHHWFLRHLYFPLKKRGWSNVAARLVVFFVSAFLHELLVSVPVRTVKLWAFFAMMGQLPLIASTKHMQRVLNASQLGNVVFWLAFTIFGQPLCILLYYYGWLQENGISAAALQ